MTRAAAPALALLAACGEDGGNDTMWTGLSGIVIVVIIVWFVIRAINKRG